MRHAIAATAAIALLALAGCSNGDTTAKPSPSSSSDPVGYLYRVDDGKHPRADVQALVDRLGNRCTDDLLGLAFAATNTAVDLVDGIHRQDVYAVLVKVADGLPAGGKVACQKRLADAAKQIRASR